MKFLQLAEEINGKILRIRRHLHQYPELSFQEFETSRLVEKVLRDAGLEVTTGIAGTGVVGLIRGKQPGKTLAIRADMDALPIKEETGLDFSSCNEGVMHACGHDFHTSILLGTAMLLNKCKEQIQGNIKFIFQPAEEKLGGAEKMIEEGVLKNPSVDAIIALHCWPELPAGTIGIRKGALMAATDLLDITVKGVAGHAAHPHKSVDPIVISGHILTALQTIVSREVAPVDSSVITIGKIIGGSAHNIIAPNVKLSGTVRTINPELRKKMPAMIKRMVVNIAASMNGTAEVNYTFGSPPLINNEEIVDIVGSAVTDLLGKEKLVHLNYPSMGGEDFAFYLEQLPGMMFRLGTANEKMESKLALHNSRLIFDENSIATGIAIMCEVAMRYCAKIVNGNPELKNIHSEVD